MKFGRLSVAMLVLLAAVAMPAVAQMESMKVNIPFAFSVDKKAFSAGEYRISRTGDHCRECYRLSGNNGSAIFFFTHSYQSLWVAHNPTSLVFANLGGGQYALLRVWAGDAFYGSELSTSDFKNRMIAKASPDGKFGTVEVIAALQQPK